MSKFYIDATVSGRNDIDITPAPDLRDGTEFRKYTADIFAAIQARDGITFRSLREVPCPHRDAAYWLNLALHELKSAGRISERGVGFGL